MMSSISTSVNGVEHEGVLGVEGKRAVLTREALEAAADTLQAYKDPMMKGDVTLVELGLGYFKKDLENGKAPTLGELHQELKQLVEDGYGMNRILVEPQEGGDEFIARPHDIDHGLNIIASGALRAAAATLGITLGREKGE